MHPCGYVRILLTTNFFLLYFSIYWTTHGRRWLEESQLSVLSSSSSSHPNRERESWGEPIKKFNNRAFLAICQDLWRATVGLWPIMEIALKWMGNFLLLLLLLPSLSLDPLSSIRRGKRRGTGKTEYEITSQPTYFFTPGYNMENGVWAI